MKSKHGPSKKNPNRKTNGSPPQPELQLEQQHFGITRLEYIAAPVIAVLVAIWAFSYLGTSIEWDDLFYMNVSQYTTRQAWVLNRYGHIYLQKFFMWLVSDALTGAKVYWSFLFFSTCVLVYWCARILAGRRGYIIGVIAVILFCTQPLLAYYAGCTFADFTVMFLIMLGTFVYLAFLQGSQKYRYLVIVVLGLIFFWAVKSKETGVCMGVLFLGLGQDSAGVRSTSRFFRDIGWVCLGMVAGFVLLMVLDLAFIGDAFFSIRLSSLKELFRFNYRHPSPRSPKLAMSWYTYFTIKPLLGPFILYLLAGFSFSRRGFSDRQKILWALPLVILFFLSTIRARLHIVPRYYLPAIACFSIWAAQFFRFQIGGRIFNKKNNAGITKLPVALALIFIAFIIVKISMSYVPDFVKYYKLRDIELFYTVAIMTLSTMVLIMVAVLSTKRGLLALFLSSLSFFFIIYFPISSNLASLKQKVTARRSEFRYEPYRVFASDLRFGKDIKMLVSKDVHARLRFLGREVRAHCWMFNIFFNEKYDYEQFIDGTWEDILKGDYTYGFVTWQDWKGIREKHNVEHLSKAYVLKPDKKTQIILLKKR